MSLWDPLVPLFYYSRVISFLCIVCDFLLSYFWLFTLKYQCSLLSLFVRVVVIYMLMILIGSYKFVEFYFRSVLFCYYVLIFHQGVSESGSSKGWTHIKSLLDMVMIRRCISLKCPWCGKGVNDDMSMCRWKSFHLKENIIDRLTLEGKIVKKQMSDISLILLRKIHVEHFISSRIYILNALKF